MVERFIGRILTDDVFRAAVKLNFQTACTTEGFFFSSDEERIVRSIDTTQFDMLASRIDGAIKRCRSQGRHAGQS